MIARAPALGMDTEPACEDAEPIGVVEEGTLSSQPLSCEVNCALLAEYQLPAWVASRVPGMMRDGEIELLLHYG